MWNTRGRFSVDLSRAGGGAPFGGQTAPSARPYAAWVAVPAAPLMLAAAP